MSIELWLEADPALSPDHHPDEHQFNLWAESLFKFLQQNARLLPSSIYIDAILAQRTLSMAIRVVDEREGRTLNLQYRGRDYATNVLSFPAELPDWLPQELDELPLGDLIICAPVVAQESQQQGKANADHWLHLFVHGSLHLLGLDHIEDEQANAMEALEIAILASLGCNNPYLVMPDTLVGTEE